MLRPLDLQPLWQGVQPGGGSGPALGEAWGRTHRPDWAARGLILWPRGGQWRHLQLRCPCPESLRPLAAGARARLVLRWWADRAELWVDGQRVHSGDLFDTACRWTLPERWWQGEALDLELRLRSPVHDDGALMTSRIELEPLDPADPLGLLAATAAELRELRRAHGRTEAPGEGLLHVLGHAHLDLAWLWPVADTWQAAERTFASALDLMERFGSLHFGHSTPALYAWLERHRPALFARLRQAMAAGRFEPLNGPWVESDCVLLSTSSLLRQFQEGQHYSRRTFPEWSHRLAWLPDSFGFAAGLPALAAATGVRWFCTHKLAWNATNPFPHRLFRWRSRCGAEVLALMTAPIGSDGDPVAMERYRLQWQQASGCADALWLPGVGDHGGGPTAEMLEQLELWQGQPVAAGQRHGTLRAYLDPLESLAGQLPVWRDELYLELHRGCATSRPDQKRHNRSLERLLREADLAAALFAQPAEAVEASEGDWRSLLFQQFHDILPGTSIPEVFEQAEPQWRNARRGAARRRDRALGRCLDGGAPAGAAEAWCAMQLQPLPAQPRTLRLPAGDWWLAGTDGDGERRLGGQPAPGGGQWLQIPGIEGVGVQRLRRQGSGAKFWPVEGAVRLERAEAGGPDHWQLSNGRLSVLVGPRGVEQLFDAAGTPQLAGPLAWCRWRDRGEFWDAWDLAADYRQHPLEWSWQGAPQWLETGPLCGRFVWRGRCGESPVRLDGRLLAGSPWLELVLSTRWQQRHELLRLEIPLAAPVCRWAADTSGGVIERPATARTARERARWEVSAISWLASVGPGRGDGLAVLLDGPQGVSATAETLGISLLRGPTWPDPGADNGWQRQRLALLPCPDGWRAAAAPQQATRLREPLWCRPMVAAAASGEPVAPGATFFPALGDDLQLVALRPLPAEGNQAGMGEVLLSVQNLGPCRRRLCTGPDWAVLERCDGLGQGLADDGSGDHLLLSPWQLGHWKLARGRT
ncbi:MULTISPECIES: alpha-mannosidase [unclassified Cyanobium]|uniref:alpha-mannosidase n=1 Tax=unclassified Cyanobium TaxID=2627006 RepID=UPI0020CC2AFA|nr:MULTISPECIES: alpha-mannosidase [unclassified Cyanobium]MCP9859500.1 alpha-mannosidase [Cyanobium sp. Cruz-8H5]MCP9866558.1 alpha-mannosidase [Cyanobium sp. Cruz-8D1]